MPLLLCVVLPNGLPADISYRKIPLLLVLIRVIPSDFSGSS